MSGSKVAAQRPIPNSSSHVRNLTAALRRATRSVSSSAVSMRWISSRIVFANRSGVVRSARRLSHTPSPVSRRATAFDVAPSALPSASTCSPDTVPAVNASASSGTFAAVSARRAARSASRADVRASRSNVAGRVRRHAPHLTSQDRRPSLQHRHQPANGGDPGL